MIFSIGLYTALLVFSMGLAWKIVSWFRGTIGLDKNKFWQRPVPIFYRLTKRVLSRDIFKMITALFFDVILQRRILKNSRIRWLAHLCIVSGFLFLLVFHAAGNTLSTAVSAGHLSTLNPFLFLRNLAGLLVLAGGFTLAGLRIKRQKIRLPHRIVDNAALLLLAITLTTGFFLEGLNIASEHLFHQMVTDYSDLEKGEDLDHLESFWQKEFSVVFSSADIRCDKKSIEKGRQVHAYYCEECHSPIQWAFVSYGIARAMHPAVPWFTSARAGAGLYTVHFLASFAVLALLPFTGLLHILATPLLLIITSVIGPEKTDSRTAALIRNIELSACMHCTICTAHCKVAIALDETQNLTQLPSEKLASLARMASGQKLSPREMQAINLGADLCTGCFQCTQICPAGINLQDLWMAMKQDLSDAGYQTAYHRAQKMADQAARPGRNLDIINVPGKSREKVETLSTHSLSFKNCFGCRECTNACPIVSLWNHPLEALDLLPHQVIRCLCLGLFEQAAGARMTWTCLTCYRCQEACPQGVQVTDIFNELRQTAFRLHSKRGDSPCATHYF